MGLESATSPCTDDDEEEDGRARAKAAAAAASSAVPCSICLDAVTDQGDRSTAKLQCGHQFHLDCIGSAFNAKGVMQCPNCRKIEKGNWLYASGHFSLPEFNIDDWLHDEELYDLNLFEMPYGVQWCPFSRLARATSSVEDAELSPAMAFHDLLGHQTALTDHPANSSATHCPYIAYFRTTQPSSSSSGSQVQTESTLEGLAIQHSWSTPSGSIDISNSNGFLAIDHASSSWDSSSGSSGHGFHSTEQTSVPSAIRAARINSDVRHRLVHPSIFSHGVPPRSSTPATTSVVAPHVRNPRRSHAREIQPLPQHRAMPGHYSNIWRSGNARIPSSSGPALSQSHNAGAYHFTAATSRAPQESEGRAGSQFYAWERERLGPFPFLPIERESHWWVFPPQASNGSSDQSRQAGYWSQRTPEMSSSPSQPPQMHPFI